MAKTIFGCLCVCVGVHVKTRNYYKRECQNHTDPKINSGNFKVRMGKTNTMLMHIINFSFPPWPFLEGWRSTCENYGESFLRLACSCLSILRTLYDEIWHVLFVWFCILYLPFNKNEEGIKLWEAVLTESGANYLKPHSSVLIIRGRNKFMLGAIVASLQSHDCHLQCSLLASHKEN